MANEIWQGSAGSLGADWNVGSNWNTGNVPQAGDTVTIPAGTPPPDLSGAAADIGSLTVASGASADLTGDLTITGNLVDSGGLGVDFQQLVEFGGSTLTIDGTLTAANGGAPFAIGNRFQTAPTTVFAGAVTNTGGFNIAGNAGGNAQPPVLAELDVASTAGFGGMAGVLTGNISLGIGLAGGGGAGDALLDFAGGGLINTIENGTVALTGPLAFIASGNATSSNSALAGPLTIANTGTLMLQSGASVSTEALTDAGSIGVDTGFLAAGGSVITIVGLLTVTGILTLGRSAMIAAGPTVTAAGGLDNTGTIDLTGDAPDALQGVLDIGGTAGFGTAGDLSGSVNLSGFSLLDFATGLIASIDNTGHLSIDGPSAFLASGTATSSNSALTDLATMDGFFTLLDGAALATTTSISVADGVNFSNLNVDNSGAGGSTLNIGGTLTLNSFGGLTIGNGSITAAALVTVAALDLSGTNNAGITVMGGLPQNSGSAQATLDVASAVGFGQAGMLADGSVSLAGDAVLDFTAGGQLTTTDFGTNLSIDGANAFLASGDATASNSALTSLTNLAGGLTLLDGAAVVTSGNLSVGNGTNGANVAVKNGAGLTVDGTLSLVGFPDTLVVQSATASAAALSNAGSVTVSQNATLDVIGLLSNADALNIGNGFTATVSAGGLGNTGEIAISGGTGLASLDIAAAAPATWTGTANLAGDALLQFAGGSIDTIGAGAQLLLNGGQAFVADAGATTSNGALADLSANAGGSLLVENGASVATTPGVNFTNAAGTAGGIDGDRIGIDDLGFGGVGGSTLSIGGALDNTGNVFVGSPFLTSAATLDAAALVNTGSLNIFGNTANTAQGTIAIAGAAPATWTGNVNLNFDALLEFGGATGITAIAQGASIDLNGAHARIALPSANSVISNSALTGLISNSGSLILTSGAVIVTTAATASAFVNSGTVTIGSGSSFFDDSQLGYVQAGGSTVVAGTLQAAFVEIAGGTFEIAGGSVSGPISFSPVPGGELKIDAATPATMPSNILDASVGDTIDLANVAFDPNGSATLLAGNVLQVTEHGTSFDLNFDPHLTFVGETFQTSSDHANGTAITMTGPAPYAVSDPLMTNASGTLVFDQVTGGQIVFTAIGGLGPEWEFDGAGFFLNNGNGNPGFLIRDTGNVNPGALFVGEVANGAASFTPIGGLGLEWQFEGNADFLGTGQSEFLIRNTGTVEPGTLDLGQVVNGAVQYTQIGGLGLEWQFAGSGNFLGDGNQGFLIRNTGAAEPGALDVGEVVNGTAQFTPIGGLGLEWNFAGTGDFFGAGHTDFLVENSGTAEPGTVAIGEVDSSQLNFTTITGLGPEWQFVGTGNYIDSNKTDFLLRDTADGALVVGSVTGALGNATANFTTVGGIGPEWSFHLGNAALLA